ncbi:hypothetical protein [Sphingomonas sp. NIBR02145]|uniref:hypothetical protein n=1 Tax=Sphingomonas sp. NIBR02145 TaxID=3014784 RepID=UPI0022B364BA|nr:hypothetical protein [Sphingomonas sp. NIBR02145]WHU04369.1 hypothetical protein O3305_07205 [Sphingomonas sp. NIBR02145]
MTRPNEPDADLRPKAGKRPVLARPVDPGAGAKIGTGGGYSCQEYECAGQTEWRAEQQRRALPADGAVHGSGAGTGGGNPGEDYDPDSQNGSGYPRTGAEGEAQIEAAEDQP